MSAVQAVSNETETATAETTSLSIGVPASIMLVAAGVALVLARCRRVDGLLLRQRPLCSPTLGRFLSLDFAVHLVIVAGLVLCLAWYVGGLARGCGCCARARRRGGAGCIRVGGRGRAGVSCCRRRCGPRR